MPQRTLTTGARKLLLAAQFAANHECEFDVSDALAAIIARVDRHIETLDRLCLQAAR